MMRGAGLRKFEFLADSCHVHLAIGKQRHNAEPGFVAKRVEYSCQFFKVLIRVAMILPLRGSGKRMRHLCRHEISLYEGIFTKETIDAAIILQGVRHKRACCPIPQFNRR